MNACASMVKGKTRATPRLRASCDRCHHAKVKCIYEDDPDCVRCKKRNYGCVRSVSMPVGRTPKSKSDPYPTPEESRSPSFADASTLETPAAFARRNSTLSTVRTDDPVPFEESVLDFTQPTFSITDFEPPFTPMTVGWFGPTTALYPETPSSQQVQQPAPAVSPPSSAESTPRPDNRRRSSCVFQPSCTCFDVLGRTLRDLQQSPVEGKTLDHVLRLNRALMKVMLDVIACEGAHGASLDFTVYTCLNKLIATYHEALYMPCDSSVRFGSYTVNPEDRVALKCQIILLDIKKIMVMLEQLEVKNCLRDSPAPGEQDGGGRAEGGYRRERQLLHCFTKNEADRVTKHIQLWGG